MSSVVKSPVEEADFLSGRSVVTPDHGGYSWLGRRTADWSLLLTLGGEGEVISAGTALRVVRGDLLLVEPGFPHRFRAGEEWDLLWFHFLLPERLSALVPWPEAAPGVGRVRLAGRLFRHAAAALLEAHRSDLVRARNWRLMAENRLENALLRASSAAAADTGVDPRIIRARRLLTDPAGPVSIDRIAACCGMSRAVFYARFRETVGVSPRRCRELARLGRARQLLESTRLPVAEVARQCGMPDVYHFSNRFRKLEGISPSAYRLREQRCSGEGSSGKPADSGECSAK